MTPGETLKALRVARGLTQAGLAARAGIDRSWLNQMERGNRPIGPKPAARLAEVLGVSPEELGASVGDAPKYRSLLERMGELEGEVADLTVGLDAAKRAHQRLLRRVAVLEEAQSQRAGQATRRGRTGR